MFYNRKKVLPNIGRVYKTSVFILLAFSVVGCSKAPTEAEQQAKETEVATTKATTTVDKSSELKYAKLSSFLEVLQNNDKFMASVAIRDNGKLVYEYQVGFADLDNNLKATANSKYRIGSITKTYTAVMAMQLVEIGELSLAQTLDEFYPQIPNAENISIEQMLSHKSGIFNFTNDPAYLEYMETAKSKEDLLSIISAFPSDFTPGSKFSYSNSNYVLLGFIIEDITKQSFAVALQEKILKPLKLKSTYFDEGISPINTSNNEVKSYSYKGKWVDATETNMSIPHAAGAIVSTANDVSLFLHALFNEQLLTAESLDLMTKKGEYGLGLVSYPFYDKVGYGHNGGIDGFVSNAAHLPKENVTITVLSNAVNTAFNDVLIAVLSEQFNQPYSIPTFEKKAPATGEVDFSLYVGEYASKQMPLKIKVFEESGQMMAQATGQGAFPLERKSQHDFGFDQAGILMEFNPDEKSFVLNQGGAKFTFTLVK